jgi:hypothetical protein
MKSILNLQDSSLFLMLSTLVLVLLFSIAIMLFLHYRNIKLQKLKLEINFQKLLHQYHQMKSLVSPKFTFGTQALEQKIDQISNKLNSSTLRKHPETYQIKQEILDINTLLKEWRRSIEQHRVIITIESFTNQFPILLELNNTEKKILLYSIMGYGIQDISTMLSLSQQHIRNSKSKILKWLSEFYQEEITIASLQKLVKVYPEENQIGIETY